MSEFGNPIDLRACLTSGQVFRFAESEGVWAGVDGVHRYELREPLNLPLDSELERFFRLDWDYDEVLPELIRRGPEMEQLCLRCNGLRLLRPSCPRETLFSFLCTSNNHISRISQMVDKLAAHGEALDGNATRWPSLERIAEIGEQRLRDLGFGYRAKTIPLVAQAIVHAGGEKWFIEAASTPYEELTSELMALPGIGPKLADCIALYAFDKTEAVPIDTHLWQAATRTYFPEWRGQNLTDQRRKHVGGFMRDRFGTLAGLAQQLLFYSNLRTLWPEESSKTVGIPKMPC